MQCKLRHLAATSLDATTAITNGTLRDLAAHGACVVTLGIPGAPRVDTVSHVAVTLRKLDVSGRACGVGDAGLVLATRVRIINVSRNGAVRTVAPFAASLRELMASSGILDVCGIDDAGLVSATRIRVLDATANAAISTVAPFAASLRSLGACDRRCGIGDAGLLTATGLKVLNAAGNAAISSASPFGASLRKLNASNGCGIDDAGLAQATRIRELCASYNENIRSVSPFAASLNVRRQARDLPFTSRRAPASARPPRMPVQALP